MLLGSCFPSCASVSPGEMGIAPASQPASERGESAPCSTCGEMEMWEGEAAGPASHSQESPSLYCSHKILPCPRTARVPGRWHFRSDHDQGTSFSSNLAGPRFYSLPTISAPVCSSHKEKVHFLVAIALTSTWALNTAGLRLLPASSLGTATRTIPAVLHEAPANTLALLELGRLSHRQREANEGAALPTGLSAGQRA